MYAGKFIFSQLVANLPMHTFRQCVDRYQGERYVKQFRCLDQYCLASTILSGLTTIKMAG